MATLEVLVMQDLVTIITRWSNWAILVYTTHFDLI